MVLGGKLEVKFSQRVIYINEFNKLALEYWNKTRYKDIGEVTFFLKGVEFIFPMQACQLFSWMEELLKKGKQVYLKIDETSRNSQLFSFLYRHSFFLKVDSYDNFFCERLEYSQIPLSAKWSPSDFSIDFSAFENEESFNRFMSKQAGANDSNIGLRLNTHFLDLKRNLTNIIIKEMGANVFAHNKDSTAYLVVTEQNEEYLRKLKNLPKFFLDFIQSAGKTDFLEVVITDLGVGICETLKSDFNSNSIALSKFKNKSNNENILKYAFWRESSRKDRMTEERIFDELDMPDLILPSGLFFCKELVETNNGLMIVQCNNELCTYVFQDSQLKYVSKEEWKLTSKPLNKGTSISILIPKKPIIQYPKPIKIENKTTTLLKVLEILSWQYTIDEDKNDLENIKNFSQLIVDKMELRSDSKDIGTLVVDLSNYGAQSKYLYKIICYCMFFASQKHPILIANLPEDLFSAHTMAELFMQARSKEHFEPIYWYGEEQTGLIDWDGQCHQIEFNKTDIEKQLKEFNTSYLQEKIESCHDLEALAYIPKPSNNFIKGYYELSKVVEDPNFCFSAVDIISSTVTL